MVAEEGTRRLGVYKREGREEAWRTGRLKDGYAKDILGRVGMPAVLSSRQ